MNFLKQAYRLLHRDHLIWAMTAKAHVFIALLAAFLFLESTNVYLATGNRIYAGFLLGIAVGMFYGTHWHHEFGKHWVFYRRFYASKTKNSQRMKMLAKKIDYELPSYLASVIFGFVLVYLAVNGFVWLSSGLFFGFAFGGSIAMAIVLNDLA
ncbi:MAG: hypothetical protein V1836_03550 [Candidatus Aenigmatarchaeota archaeon]